MDTKNTPNGSMNKETKNTPETPKAGATLGNDKYTMGVVAGIVVVVIIIVLFMGNKKGTTPAPAAVATPDPSALVAPAVPTEDTSSGSIHAALPPTAFLSYDDALVQYAGKRVQFDTECHAVPNSLTFKNGTELMLDNRSAEDRTLHLGFMGDVSIKAWGFKIVMFTTTDSLPEAVVIDCGMQQNVAEAIIQK